MLKESNSRNFLQGFRQSILCSKIDRCNEHEKFLLCCLGSEHKRRQNSFFRISL